MFENDKDNAKVLQNVENGWRSCQDVDKKTWGGGGGNTHTAKHYGHTSGQAGNTIVGKIDKNISADKAFLYILKFIFSNKGAILIEFALSIPILLTLLYYIHDLPKLTSIQERMEFCAHCAINMLQNISRGRSENQRITRADIMQIAHAMWLPFLGGGIRQYSITAPTTTRTYIMPCGYVPQIELYCFKGTGDGKARHCWLVNANCALGANPANIDINNDMRIYSPIKTRAGSIYNVSEIYEGFNVKEGEMKIIVLLRLCLNNYVSPADGMNFTLSQRLGLLLISISGGLAGTYLHRVVFFTPRPDIFSETAPQ